MKYPIWKPIVILLVLLGCAALMYPPKQRLKPGLDLAGGTTLIYDVHVPNNADATRVIDELINVLRDRIDPTGTRNLVWRQIAGNRIEIQMALATQEAKDRRAAYLELRDELLEANLSPGAVSAALRLDGAQRDAELDRLADGSDALRTQLAELAAAHDTLVAATAPYRAAQEALDQAQEALDKLPADASDDQRNEAQGQVDALLQDLITRTREYRAARDAFEAAEKQVLASNVEPSELEKVLSAPVKPERAGKPARAELLQQLKDEYPARAAKIQQVYDAYIAYDQVKGPLDDPNDLIAQLQGSGVLEFRIAPTPGELPNESGYREQLHERGPRGGGERPYRWFPVDDIDQFVDDAAAQALLDENPQLFFTRFNLVGEMYGDEYYVLLANTPDRAMTREQDWELRSASRGFDELSRSAVNFELDVPGASLMGAITGPNVGKPMAILLDGKVISAPNLNSQINGRGQITGSFSPAELDYLLRTIKAGSSEAELSEYPISIKTIGPQLGQDNLRSGVMACIIAMIAVGGLMIVYYFGLGLAAVLALLCNLIIILGVMAMFGATYTLPGIAGMVLTIGMAVDANVLIYERIREERKRGVDVPTAVRLGFDKALSSIVDGNLTTFAIGVVLFYTGTADIVGFATTLMIGILANFFCALFVTRVAIDMYVVYGRPRRIPMLPLLIRSIDRLLSPNVDWVGKWPIFLSISVVLVITSLVLVFERGVDMLDIEFRAGTQVSFELADDQTLAIGDVRERMALFGEVGGLIQKRGELDPATLSPQQQAVYPQVLELVNDARQRHERQLALAEQAAASGSPAPSVPDSPPDFELLEQATIVTEGETNDGRANGFNVATLITDAQTVSDVVKTAFADLLDVKRPLEFEGMQDDIGATAAVHAVDSTNLGEAIGRADVTTQVPEFLGGVAIVLEDITPATTIEDLTQRIERMRLQPSYQELGYRPFRVVGLDATEPASANGAAGERHFRSAVVVVADSQVNYAENPGELRDAGGLADTEWNLVRDALQRDTSLSSVSNFSGQVSDTMRQQAIAAIALSLLVMVAYVWFRFGNISYGLAGVVTLTHDVCVALGVLALSAWVYDTSIGRLLLLEPFKIDLAIIAALMTILGYSINDTIVVYDRLRENRGRLSVATKQIVNDAINQTLSRTIITMGTTLLAVLVLYIVAGPAIRGFALTVLVGVGIGTYSSIAIAAPLVLFAANRAQRKAQARQQTERATAAA